MKKKYVLKKNYEFDEIIKNGKKVSNDYFIIFFLRYSDEKEYKIGISVGKKYGNAPTRNKEKRRVRHMIRNNAGMIGKNKRYVIISKRKEGSFSIKEKKLMNLFERTKSEK